MRNGLLRNWFAVTFTFALACWIPAAARADVPNSVNYQGTLLNGGGTPVADGSYSATFKLYDVPSGGAVLWTESKMITTSAGHFTTILGSVTPLPISLFNSPTRYLGISVSPDPEMSPRTVLVSVPYSYRVGTVDGASGGSISSKTSIGPGHAPSGAGVFIAGDSDTASGDYSICLGLANSSVDPGTTISGGEGNRAAGFGSTISGGRYNRTMNGLATIGGGGNNEVSGFSSTIGGGSVNQAGGDSSFVGGGVMNRSLGQLSSIGGGLSNLAQGSYATIAGGDSNAALANFATVAGGRSDSAVGYASTVGGGEFNWTTGLNSTVAGGQSNGAAGNFSSVSGGNNNKAWGWYATIAGGWSVTASGHSSTVAGGNSNTAGGDSSTVSGGTRNGATALSSTVGGGWRDTAGASFAVVAGGDHNVVTAPYGTIGGGTANRVTNAAGTIAGGSANSCGGQDGFLGGGWSNQANGFRSVVGGGTQNVATGFNSIIPGGEANAATADYSLAAGRRAKAGNNGAFVWADNNTFDFPAAGEANFTPAANNFLARVSGGAVLVSGIDGTGKSTAGVKLAAGGGSWSSLSDRSAKENYESIDGEALLNRLALMPIGTWNYKAQAPSIRHIGPMAQDFNASFGVGEDERFITGSDADGVALAAVQALYQRSLEVDSLKTEVTELRKLVAQLEHAVSRLGERAAPTIR